MRNPHLLPILLLAAAATAAATAQQPEPYTVPRTAYGDPDFQGVWATDFLTTQERPPGIPNLIAGPEQAQAIVAAIRSMLPDVLDPDVQNHDIAQLAKVKGEYRTSLVVEPEDGLMPLTEAGLELANWALMRDVKLFDGPEQRPLTERCMESFGFPPMRGIPVFIPRQIFQNRQTLVMLTEDAAGLRIIRLGGEPPPEAVRSIEGYSIGHWEGDTLVVETTNLRAEDPARFTMPPRPVVLSPDTRITEWFTRVSETELFYRVTVEDDKLYSQPWTGEFSMVLWDAPIFEYACHEGNYSMPTILRGGQAEQARLAETGNTGD